MSDTTSLREQALARGTATDVRTELGSFETLIAFALVVDTTTSATDR
jgi:hypothetical protein